MPRAPKEDDLLQEVMARAARAGVKALHIDTPFRNRRSSGLVGMPDLILIGHAGTIFRELKRDRYQDLSSAQIEVKHELLAMGRDFAVWTPDDLASGQIDQELAALSALRQMAGTANIAVKPDGNPVVGPDGSPLDIEAGVRAFHAAMAAGSSSGSRRRTRAKPAGIR
jgi:hypothetical protein